MCAGSQWATPQVNTPRITRAKSHNRRSTAHPFATSGGSRNFHAASHTREREGTRYKHRKSLQNLLPNSRKRANVESLANVPGAAGYADGQNANPRQGKWLEGAFGASTTFVETFMCLWGLWRERVEAGTAEDMHQVTLPSACVPQCLSAHPSSALLK